MPFDMRRFEFVGCPYMAGKRSPVMTAPGAICSRELISFPGTGTCCSTVAVRVVAISAFVVSINGDCSSDTVIVWLAFPTESRKLTVVVCPTSTTVFSLVVAKFVDVAVTTYWLGCSTGN
jgi:hypothetical protein